MPSTRRSLLVSPLILLLVISSCSINVKKEANGQDKEVDIRTPFSGIHVSKGANAQDTGIAVYPGARQRERGSGEDKSANVNITGFGYGVRVVALEYESTDSPDKIVAYYKDQLRRYGNVLICHTSHFNVNADVKNHETDSHELTCESSSGVDIELKVGTRENQHIVAVEPQGSGSNFSLVYVRTHGKDAEI